MARPKRDGLLYFSFDTDFFYADSRIKRLHSRYKNDGLMLYVYLLAEIYRNGYYIKWDRETAENAAADLFLKEGYIQEVLAFAVRRSILTRVTILADGDTAPQQKECEGISGWGVDSHKGDYTRLTGHYLTSPGIQRRYQEAVKGLKRDVFVDPEIWLLDEEETAPHIKVTHKNSKSEKNHSKSEKNHSKSEKNCINEMKRKEMKEIKDMCKSDDFHSFFENIWKQYPVKKGKGKVSDAQKKKLFKIGHDEMARAIERYKKYVDSIDYLHYQNGGRFFNSGYIDYLDANYTPDKQKPKKGGFNNFPQREYDYAELEKKILLGGTEDDERGNSVGV